LFSISGTARFSARKIGLFSWLDLSKNFSYSHADFISNPAVFKVVFNDTITDLTLLSDVPFGLDGGKIGLIHQDKDGNDLTYTQTWMPHEDGGTILVDEGAAEISGNVTDVVGSDGLTKARSKILG
jgi:hypothetical protein